MEFRSPSLSRRHVLAGMAGATALGFAGVPALAKAPMAIGDGPRVHRFKLGAIEATVISDGALSLGEAGPGMFKGYSKERIDELFAENFIDGKNLQVDQNALVINTGDKVVLIDTGMGTKKMFGDKSGQLLSNLHAAGINPREIDAVIVTHAHPDHCFGLMDIDNAYNFPNAQIYMTQADLEFWTDEAKSSHPLIGGLIAPTRSSLLPNRDRMVFIKDGQEIVPGIHAVATPGHTVGHMSFAISSEGKSLLYTADIAHQYVLTTANPRAEFIFDTDPQQAIATRLRMFDMIAAQKMPILVYHFPWPGLGHLAKTGDTYRWLPASVTTVL